MDGEAGYALDAASIVELRRLLRWWRRISRDLTGRRGRPLWSALALRWGAVVEDYSSGNSVAVNPCRDREGSEVITDETITLYIFQALANISGETPGVSPGSVNLSAGDIVAYLAIGESEGLLLSAPVESVAGGLLYGVAYAETPWSSGGKWINLHPCDDLEGTGEDTDTIVKAFIYTPSTKAPVFVDVAQDEVLAYLSLGTDGEGDPIGLLIAPAIYCLPSNADAEENWVLRITADVGGSNDPSKWAAGEVYGTDDP